MGSIYVSLRFTTLSFVIFLIYFISLEKCLHRCQHKSSSLVDYGYTDREEPSESDDIPAKALSGVETPHVDYPSTEIPDNTNGNLFVDEYCHNPEASTVDKIKGFFKQAFCSAKDRCAQAQYYKQLHDSFVNIIEEYSRIGKCSICLIDSGINISSHILKGYYKDRNFSGISTVKCTEENYRHCETFDLYDESENNHGTFIADIVTNGDIFAPRRNKLKSFINVCKAFGEKGKSHVFPLMKCLEYCKQSRSKIIHVSYNVKSYNYKLRTIIEDLYNKNIIVVVPSQSIYDEKETYYRDSSHNYKNWVDPMFKEEHDSVSGPRNLVFPAAFAGNYDNVLSVGSLEFSQFYEEQIDSKKILFKDYSNMVDTSFFYFIYPFLYHKYYDHSLYYLPSFASASFTRLLSIVIILNPRTTLKCIQDGLNRSVVRHPYLSGLSKYGGYLHVPLMLNYALKGRYLFYKINYERVVF